MRNIIFDSKTIFLIFNVVTCTYAVDPCSEQFDVVTDLTRDDCEPGFHYQKTGNYKDEGSPNTPNCFPKCFKDYGIGTINCDPNPCPFGYLCVADHNGDKFCQVDQNSCLRYEVGDNDNPWKQAIWKPECLPDGTWKPKQCKPDATTGRCFCFDAVGNRIFGQEFTEKSSNMTCACSRKRAELIKTAPRFHISLHCDSMGNYEPLQCDSGQCWCVEPQTGKITTKVVTEKAMALLPCYSKENVGDQYLRQCESEEYAKANILNEFNIHGTAYANLPPVLCDADGTYGPYQVVDGSTLCTWKDKSSLIATVPTIEVLDCNCVRDRKIYQLAGREQTLLCASNGGYKPAQQSNNKWYCVDKDGFRKSGYFNTEPIIGQCDNYLQ